MEGVVEVDYEGMDDGLEDLQLVLHRFNCPRLVQIPLVHYFHGVVLDVRHLWNIVFLLILIPHLLGVALVLLNHITTSFLDEPDNSSGANPYNLDQLEMTLVDLARQAPLVFVFQYMVEVRVEQELVGVHVSESCLDFSGYFILHFVFLHKLLAIPHVF